MSDDFEFSGQIKAYFARHYYNWEWKTTDFGISFTNATNRDQFVVVMPGKRLVSVMGKYENIEFCIKNSDPKKTVKALIALFN